MIRWNVVFSLTCVALALYVLFGLTALGVFMLIVGGLNAYWDWEDQC